MMGPRVAGLSVERLGRIGPFLQDRFIGPGLIPGAQVLVARRGEVAYREAFGLMDEARSRPWMEDAVVRIYSMTKPVVSLALMQLYERGLFQLDEPVTRVLPEWRDMRVWVEGEGASMRTQACAPVTYRQLLSHTAGLTYGALLEGFGIKGPRHPVDQAYVNLRVRRDATEDLDAFVAKLGQVPLLYPPGERWAYSLATDVVGALVQRLAGRPLDQVLRDEVLEPLGMADTGFQVRADQRDRFAACYQRGADGARTLQDDPETSPFLQPPRFLSGGGGLVSTLQDYHRFCEMLRRGGELEGRRLIGSRTLRLMTANHLPGGASLAELALDGFSETVPRGVGFGLGFAMVTDGVRAGSPSEGDVYWGGAASTLFWVDPREELVVIFLTQCLPSTSFDFRGPLKSLVYAALED